MTFGNVDTDTNEPAKDRNRDLNNYKLKLDST